MDNDTPEMPGDIIAETENYTVWTAEELDGEMMYHLEIGPVTAHFFQEEWDEFVAMISMAAGSEQSGADEEAIEVELDWGSLYFARDEWDEFLKLINQTK